MESLEPGWGFEEIEEIDTPKPVGVVGYRKEGCAFSGLCGSERESLEEDSEVLGPDSTECRE